MSTNPFADNLNPYAAPQAAGYAPVAAPVVSQGTFAGLWRQGNLLVMHKNAPLPDICLKSNQPATRRLKRKLSWHHPAVFLALLVNLILYVIIALCLQKTATIQMPLTDEWFARRRRSIVVAWVIVLSSIALFVLGVSNVESQGWAPFVLIAAIFVFLGGLIYGLVAARLVSPQRISDEYVWLKGVHPQFLDRLEIWPYNV